jgi:peptidoglycan/xylan/chitin deacetylase (PgdA/CDA1 family)
VTGYSADLDGYRFPTSRIAYPERRGLEVFPDGARMALLFYVAAEEWHWGLNEVMDPPATSRFGGEFLTLSTRSAVEYGFNVGLYRLHDFCADVGCKMSVLPNGLTIDRHREVIELFASDGHPLVGHGYSQGMPMPSLDRDGQRESIERTVEAIKSVTGAAPAGWVGTGAAADRHTIELLSEQGFMWNGDLQDDELPYFIHVGENVMLELPYRMVGGVNDLLLGTVRGTQLSPGAMIEYVLSSFDAHHKAAASSPLIMTYGMHPLISGRPDTFAALRALVDRAQSQADVWICTHDELGAWWNTRFRAAVPEGGGYIDGRAMAGS